MIYDISTLYPLHHSIIYYMKLIISESTSTLSLSSHPDYRSYNPHCMYDNTGSIYMTSYEYIWLCLWYHTMLWHHTHCIHVITPRIPGIASTVARPLLIVYWLYHNCYMCDMNCTVCMTSYEFYGHHNHSLWHPKTVFMTSHPHYSWFHTHCIWHHIHSTCDITATRTMTIHLLYFWCYTQCIWHLKCWMNDNTTTVSDMIPNVSV